MINLLLNEPYFELIDDVFIENIKVNNWFEIDAEDISLIITGDSYYGFCHKKKKIKTLTQFKSVLQDFPLEDVEEFLLGRIMNCIVIKDYWAKVTRLTEREVRAMTFLEKINYLGMDDYLADRNLNDLIMYTYLLKEIYPDLFY